MYYDYFSKILKFQFAKHGLKDTLINSGLYTCVLVHTHPIHQSICYFVLGIPGMWLIFPTVGWYCNIVGCEMTGI